MISHEMGRQVLRVPMRKNDAKAETIGDYLAKLLMLVWEHGECFNGKRPFGYSGWDGELELALVEAGLVEGTIDEDGYLEEVDEIDADLMIRFAIQAMSAQ